MTQRHNYWSIGEVLSLLQDEFPEVTISKIRFLESQGLIDPERTPSGYRRFYQSDFDRLQWILTQQRDHYLPLKVIRDRLESGEEPFLANEAERQAAERATDPGQMDGQMNLLAPVIDIRGGEVTRPPSTDAGSDVAAGGDAGGSAPATRADAMTAAAQAVDRSMTASATTGDRALSDVSLPEADGAGPATAAPDSSDAVGDTEDAEPVEDRANEHGASEHGASEHGASEHGASEHGASEHGAASASAGSGLDTARAVPEPADAVADAAGSDTGHSTGGSGMLDVDPSLALTLDELAEASGCDVAMIRDLERFNLVSGRTVGPTVLYDGEALMIARHAAQFRSYGLDPRHLRTFRVGAEREIALLAQVVEPLRHRRDPETRRKSVETMEDLTDLAASLRAILMRQITREQVPPT